MASSGHSFMAALIACTEQLTLQCSWSNASCLQGVRSLARTHARTHAQPDAPLRPPLL